MKAYTLKILILGCLLYGGLSALALRFPIFKSETILLTVLVFGLNGYMALIPFYLFRKTNPLKTFIWGSLIRNLTVGIIICFYYYHIHQNRVVFLIGCMVCFITFQSLEVYHLAKTKDLFTDKNEIKV